MQFDATALTHAGAIAALRKGKTIPPILLIEELEKCDESALRWLLGVMDARGEIRKTNYNIGNTVTECRMLVICTVNNYQIFSKMMEGALASRHSHHVFCPRPSRAALGRILSREIERVKGNYLWIEPALKYVVDEEEVNDPRRVLAVALTGRDDLLTGKFQQALRATRTPTK